MGKKTLARSPSLSECYAATDANILMRRLVDSIIEVLIFCQSKRGADHDGDIQFETDLHRRLWGHLLDEAERLKQIFAEAIRTDLRRLSNGQLVHLRTISPAPVGLPSSGNQCVQFASRRDLEQHLMAELPPNKPCVVEHFPESCIPLTHLTRLSIPANVNFALNAASNVERILGRSDLTLEYVEQSQLAVFLGPVYIHVCDPDDATCMGTTTPCLWSHHVVSVDGKLRLTFSVVREENMNPPPSSCVDVDRAALPFWGRDSSEMKTIRVPPGEAISRHTIPRTAEECAELQRLGEKGSVFPHQPLWRTLDPFLGELQSVPRIVDGLLVSSRPVNSLLVDAFDMGIPECTVSILTDILQSARHASEGNEGGVRLLLESNLCNICWSSSLLDRPLMLQCYHVLCSACVRTLLRDPSKRKCPLCNADTLRAPKIEIMSDDGDGRRAEETKHSLIRAIVRYVREISGSATPPLRRRFDSSLLHFSLVCPDTKFLKTLRQELGSTPRRNFTFVTSLFSLPCRLSTAPASRLRQHTLIVIGEGEVPSCALHEIAASISGFNTGELSVHMFYGTSRP
jgi:hypothetical protein